MILAMAMEQSLYDGRLVRLGPIDFEKDPPIESAWTHDGEFLLLTAASPSWPIPPERVRRKYEALEKEAGEEKNSFPFAVRLRSEDVARDDRLLGYARLSRIEWSNGNGWIRLAIGDPADRRKGYGSEALSLLLRIAFTELNLHRVTARIPCCNATALAFFRKHGFVEEARRRQAIRLDGRTWDEVIVGLLRGEWTGGI
jgi:RimJ/RimL family protein N-acetyltransferase